MKAVACLGTRHQPAGGLEARAMGSREAFAFRYECGSAHRVDERQRPSGVGRETPPEYRAEIGICRVREHALFEAACRLEGLAIKHALLELVGRRLLGALGKQLRQPGPQELS